MLLFCVARSPSCELFAFELLLERTFVHDMPRIRASYAAPDSHDLHDQDDQDDINRATWSSETLGSCPWVQRLLQSCRRRHDSSSVTLAPMPMHVHVPRGMWHRVSRKDVASVSQQIQCAVCGHDSAEWSSSRSARGRHACMRVSVGTTGLDGRSSRVRVARGVQPCPRSRSRAFASVSVCPLARAVSLRAAATSTTLCSARIERRAEPRLASRGTLSTS